MWTMRTLLGASLLLALMVLAGSRLARSPAQEPQKQPGVKEDREALCGDGKSAWKFEKRDAAGLTVRLYFTRGDDGKPDRGLVMRGAGGAILALGFEFNLEEKEGKRRIKVTPGSAFDGKGSDPVLPYKLEGDRLQLLGGRDGDLELKGEWKRAKLQ